MYRIVDKEEVIKSLKKSSYGQDEIDVIFAYHKDYPIEVNDEGRYRWVQKIDWQNEPGMDPNTIGDRYYSGDMTQEEYMDYNRKIGYTLYGYWEVFVFNDRFNDEQYKEDMNKIKIDNRDNIIDSLI